MLAMASKQLVAAAACAAILSGCAATGADCGPDWYAVGARDGRLGATPQAELYARRCAAAVDSTRYMDGWQAGFYERPIQEW